MKIRIGFVTNSSSTNFLILSKEEITEEYLYKKLGFVESSMLEAPARELCRNIIDGTYMGVRHFEWEEITFENIQKTFGKDAADKYKIYMKKGFHPYVGYTRSDDSIFTGFFTTDSFEIEEKDIYLNGRSCMW